MVVFILLTLAFLLFMIGFCMLLANGVRKDSLEYDLAYLWEKYPTDLHAKIRKTFE